jgi:hypothetical protein
MDAVLGCKEATDLCKQAFENGRFTEADCVERNHWSYRVPESESDIPLNKHFKPRRNKYIYQYLIECYRYRRPLHTMRIESYERGVQNARYKVQRYEAELQRMRTRLAELEPKLKNLRERYKDNTLFEGKRINLYRGV